MAGRAADSTHVPGRHKRQRTNSDSTADDRVHFSPEIMEDMIDNIAPIAFTSACRPFELLVKSVVTDTDLATNYTRTDSAQPDTEKTMTNSDSVDVDSARTTENVTKVTNKRDNDEEIKPTIETREDWVMIGHQNHSKPNQVTDSTVTPHSPQVSVSTTSSTSPPPSTWYLVARSAAAVPNALITAPPRSLHISPSPPFSQGNFVHHTTTDEVVSAAEMMMLLRSSSHLPIVNRGR